VSDAKLAKKVTKFRLEALTGKALSVLLEFIDETSEKDFCILYLADLFKNELKTKFNRVLQSGVKYKQNS